MKRREIIKGLTLLPFGGGVAALSLNAVASPLSRSSDFLKERMEAMEGELVKKGEGILQSIGVEPFINCINTFTIIGGSIVRPEVRLAMESVSTLNVQMDELAFGVGDRLAELTGAEWGMVTSGCAAGIKLATAACLSGGDPEKLLRIPDLTSFVKNEVIIPKSSRNVYDHAVRNTGAKIITVETIGDLQKAISPRTAMIYMLAESKAPLSIEDVSRIARPLNVPVFVDAAAHILTIPDVHLSRGADIVAYSGGKGIKAPGCSGLMLGRKNLLMSAWQASAPHNGFGRDNKVGREEYIGMLAAVEYWVKMDHVAEMNTWLSWLDTISKMVSKVEGVQTKVIKPDPKQMQTVTPYLRIMWNPEKIRLTGSELQEELLSITPRVGVSTGNDRADVNWIELSAFLMIPDHVKVVGKRIYEALSFERSPKSEPVKMKVPIINIVGHWDLEVEFYNSKVSQKLYIDKQEGNWLSGVYKSTYSDRPVTGSIDGNEVKLKSYYSVPGDTLTTIFSGTISDGAISGNIDMHDYLTANFMAKRHEYPLSKDIISFPKKRPKAT